MEIPLTRGIVAQVDDSDFDWLNQWDWHVSGKRGYWYASRWTYEGGIRRAVHMHKMVMGVIGPDKVDHINRNTLDNRRSNLRSVTHSQNISNSKMRANNSTGFKGVSWNKTARKWQASICKNRNLIYLGKFYTAVEAAWAYDWAAMKLFGQYALTNKQLGNYGKDEEPHN